MTVPFAAVNTIDFRKGVWPGIILKARGLSSPESWGTWSQSDTVRFEFAAPLPGEHAYYFNGLESQALADAIKCWIVLDANGKAPQSVGMPCLTWRQSAEQLISRISPESNYSLHHTV